MSFTIVGRLPMMDSIWKKNIMETLQQFSFSDLGPLTHEDEINNVRHLSQEQTTKTEVSKVPSIEPTSSVSLLAPTGPLPELTIVILSVCASGALTSAATRGRTWQVQQCLSLVRFLTEWQALAPVNNNSRSLKPPWASCPREPPPRTPSTRQPFWPSG